MKLKYLIPIILLALACNTTNEHFPEGTLYHSEHYQVFTDSVKWGDETATIISPTEIHSTFNGNDHPQKQGGKYRWKLNTDISNYPSYSSDIPLVSALYNLSLEELEKNKTPDGQLYNTGAKWEGVWTRDVSYSFLLAIAYLDPEIAKRCLMKKVKGDMIVQDTGSGGSWPVSSDRMTWVLAAWEIYKVTGEQAWLEQVYPIIKKSVDADFETIYYPESLALGESSFLDWREQSYPKWMKPIDIYRSENLGTNVVHYQTCKILAEMSALMGENGRAYARRAKQLQEKMDEELWLADQGYYAQYRYGKHHLSVSPRSEALGEALAVLFDVAEEKEQRSIVANTPVSPYGVPCFAPQIPNMEPYHNNGVWPFVQAYWNMAAAKVKNEKVLRHGLAALYRAAALFLTNKENMVAESGLAEGTAINSDRQLWSVAGNLAMVYRIFAGMRFEKDKLVFEPIILKEYGGTQTIKGFKYRNATFDITIKGYGTVVDHFFVDGKDQRPEISSDLSGHHTIEIKMMNNDFKSSKINLQPITFAPETPVINRAADEFKWNAIEGAKSYKIFENGKLVTTQTDTTYVIDKGSFAEYQVMSVNEEGVESFLSEPVITGGFMIVQAERFAERSRLPYQNYSGKGFVALSKEKNTAIEMEVKVEEKGTYLVNFRYVNGTGRMCCANTCALRTLFVNGKKIGTSVFPVIEENQWSDWGESNFLKVELKKGKHQFKLSFEPFNENMNVDVNTLMLDRLVLRKID
ncbi:MAG: MGH1-like glycoside hydrolase domain-containing protein [Flammeovirgaceae bacterium]